MSPSCHDDERFALLQFKESIIINWFASDDPSAYSKVSSWMTLSSDCCTWDGVQCDENTGHVTSLDLSSSYLYGSINSSSSLFQLVHLHRLNLASNDFNHPQIPSGVRQLSKLTYLNLSNSAFSGQIPSEILQLSKLVSLDLALNPLKLHKPNLESRAEKLINLQELVLSEVDISSTLPSTLTNLTSLKAIYLGNCGLHGEFPTGIFQLPNLKSLSVHLNSNLTGHVPEFNRSIPLEDLRLAGTGFSSMLPDSIGNLKSLHFFDVGGCNFSGPMPFSFGNLTELTFLDLSNNNFNRGTLSWVGNLSNLSILNLQHNNFHGHIPQMFIEGCQLSTINLNQNHFQGALPRSLANCTMLEILDIGNNHISDIFPSWLGNLPELGVLILRSNGFHGAIGKPETNSTFPKLHVIDLSNNYIIGKLPYEYFQIWKGMQSYDAGGLTYMQARVKIHIPSCGWLYTYTYQMTSTNKGIKTEYWKIQDYFVAIDLSGNKFEGEIPKIVGNLKALCMLNLSNNVLTGSILSSLVNLKNLESLDLSQNMLVGEIPPQLVELTFLAFLNLSHNHLTRTIPQGKQFLTFENSSFNGNVGLCGSPLLKRCTNLKDPPPPPSIFVENQDVVSLFEFDWKLVVMGYECGFIFGGFGGKIITKKKNDWFMKTFAIGHPP
uniref:Leucine-rich repeat-containing N-terminal plant-type domain-containing protein n=1 Tax=Quercus lobata TaxID=97700 RepID=A0A7N2MM58_QUELO